MLDVPHAEQAPQDHAPRRTPEREQKPLVPAVSLQQLLLPVFNIMTTSEGEMFMIISQTKTGALELRDNKSTAGTSATYTSAQLK